MNETVRPRAIVSRCLARICGLLICVISMLALMGWASGWLSIARMNPKYIPMAPSTALAFTLLSAGLFVHVRWPMRRYCSQFSAVVAILVSGLAGLLLLRFTGIFDFDPEQFLLKNPESFRGVPIGRMSPLTAAGLLLESFALIALLLAFPWWMASPSLPACLSVSATAISLVVLIGYAYGTPLLYGGTIIPVALPTAVAMLLCGLGLLAAANPHAWPLCLILGAPVHARILRAFLPVTLLAVVGEGWLINALMPHHNTNTALWVSLVVLVSTAVVSVVIAFVSRGIGGAIEQAKAALLESEEKFRSIYEGSNDAIMLLTEKGFFNCNERTLEIFGLTCKDEFVSMHPSQLSPPLQPNGQDSYTAVNEKIVTAFEQGSNRFDWMYRRKSGENFPAEVLFSAFDYQGKRVLQATVRDITERKQNEERLIYLAEHDPLTHLHNRRYFVKQLENWIAQMKRNKESGALLLLDLDNFKYINDTLGHPDGDKLLVKLAGVLRKQIRETDVIARLGGDEFAIMLPFTTQAQAQVVSEKILLSIKELCRKDKISGYGITASIGIIQFPEYGDDAALLLSCADIAMYTAKEEGRNRICVFDPKHKAKIDSRLVWENRIQQALKEDLFALYLQPIYDIQQEIACGYEVLLRMQGENLEILMPDDFLPVAERYGLIHEIDRWVVRNSIRLCAAYKVSEKGQFLNINLSGRAFNDKGLLPLIQREIFETGISPKSIMFEITETASMENMIEAASFISTLKLIGCRFALDDFGSGFSSYQNLKHLPVDCLKIDGSFIHNLHESRVDQYLIRCIVEMARGLEKKTVAEYVENEKILQLLREYGVDYAQGYYIGKPSPAGEVFSNSSVHRREHTEIAEKLAEGKQT